MGASKTFTACIFPPAGLPGSSGFALCVERRKKGRRGQKRKRTRVIICSPSVLEDMVQQVVVRKGNCELLVWRKWGDGHTVFTSGPDPVGRTQVASTLPRFHAIDRLSFSR